MHTLAWCPALVHSAAYKCVLCATITHLPPILPPSVQLWHAPGRAANSAIRDPAWRLAPALCTPRMPTGALASRRAEALQHHSAMRVLVGQQEAAGACLVPPTCVYAFMPLLLHLRCLGPLPCRALLPLPSLPPAGGCGLDRGVLGHGAAAAADGGGGARPAAFMCWRVMGSWVLHRLALHVITCRPFPTSAAAS